MIFTMADDTAFVCNTQYGGQEHLDAPPRELLLAQTEDYVEYSRHGAVLKGLEKAVARSKYEEDVLINNHTVRAEEKTTVVANVANFFHNELFNYILCVFSVFGVLTGKMAAGDTSVVAPWSNRVTAQERLELE